MLGCFVFDGSNDHISTEVNRGMLGNTPNNSCLLQRFGIPSRTYTANIGGKDQDGGCFYFNSFVGKY